MDVHDNADALWKPRAAFIRELVASGAHMPDHLQGKRSHKRKLTVREQNKLIVALCVEAGYDAPRPDAIYRAVKGYKIKGMPLPRATYYQLWVLFLDAYYRAVDSDTGIAITARMKRIIVEAETAVLQDKSGVPRTPRRARKKRKPKPTPETEHGRILETSKPDTKRVDPSASRG